MTQSTEIVAAILTAGHMQAAWSGGEPKSIDDWVARYRAFLKALAEDRARPEELRDPPLR